MLRSFFLIWAPCGEGQRFVEDKATARNTFFAKLVE